MWSKKEAKDRRVRFFTNFGVYMKKHNEEYGNKMRWVNYRTGVNSVKFRIEVDNKTAKVCIDITNEDEGVRQLFFEQFEEFKKLLSNSMDELIWVKDQYIQSGFAISRIYAETDEFSMSNEAQWGELYQFIEKNIVALHEFWDMSQDVFKDLEG